MLLQLWNIRQKNRICWLKLGLVHELTDSMKHIARLEQSWLLGKRAAGQSGYFVESFSPSLKGELLFWLDTGWINYLRLKPPIAQSWGLLFVLFSWHSRKTQRIHLLSAYLLPERKESSLGHRISDRSGPIVKKALRKHFCCSKWCFLFLFPRNANSCLTKKLSLFFGADASSLKLILCSPCTGKETSKILPDINSSLYLS